MDNIQTHSNAIKRTKGDTKINIFEQISMEFNVQHPIHTHIEETPLEQSHINIHRIVILKS